MINQIKKTLTRLRKASEKRKRLESIRKLKKYKQIINYSRWQQRNGPIIHDVTSVKYN